MEDKIWTHRQSKIEGAEEELRSWKEDESHWCYHRKDITRRSDGNMHCQGYDIVKGDILIGSCYSCGRWEKNKKEGK